VSDFIVLFFMQCYGVVLDIMYGSPSGGRGHRFESCIARQ